MENPSYYSGQRTLRTHHAQRETPLRGNYRALLQGWRFWASNGYFAELYETNPSTFQRWIAELVGHGFLNLCGSPNNPAQREMRISSPPDKIAVPPDNIVMGTPDKIATHNNTSLITTNSHKSNEPKATHRANPGRSIASALEDLTEIPDELWHAALGKHGVQPTAIADEWAKLRKPPHQRSFQAYPS
jgi:hypothetical protein